MILKSTGRVEKILTGSISAQVPNAHFEAYCRQRFIIIWFFFQSINAAILLITDTSIFATQKFYKKILLVWFTFKFKGSCY